LLFKPSQLLRRAINDGVSPVDTGEDDLD